MADKTDSESVAVDPIEQATETTKEPEFDPYSVSTDELRQKIESELYQEEAPAEEAPVEAEAEETPSVEGPAEQEEETEEAADESEEEKAAPVEELEVTEADELRALLEEQEAQTKHFESLAGSAAGAKGFLDRKVQELEARLAQLQQAPPSEEFTEETPARATQAKPATDQNTAYLVGLAINHAGQQFLAETPEVVLKDDEGKTTIDPETGQAALDPEFKAAAANVGAQIQELLQWNDPISAGQETSRILSAAWAKANLQKKRAARIEVQRRRADQAKRLKDKKRASASASTGAAPPRPKKREVDPMTMPIDELKKLAEEEARKAGLL